MAKAWITARCPLLSVNWWRLTSSSAALRWREPGRRRALPLPPLQPRLVRRCPHQRVSQTVTGSLKLHSEGKASAGSPVRMERTKGMQRRLKWIRRWTFCFTIQVSYKTLKYQCLNVFLFLLDTRWWGHLLAGEFWEVPSPLQRPGHHQRRRQ